MVLWPGSRIPTSGRCCLASCTGLSAKKEGIVSNLFLFVCLNVVIPTAVFFEVLKWGISKEQLVFNFLQAHLSLPMEAFGVVFYVVVVLLVASLTGRGSLEFGKSAYRYLSD